MASRPNPVRIKGGVAIISLNQGKECSLDVEDWIAIRHLRWTAVCRHGIWYAFNGKTRTQLHSLLLPSAERVDHWDGDGLNNRRRNLRAATHQQNLWNQRKQTRATSSRFKGVCWHKQRNKWFAYVAVNSKKKSLGCFESEVEAAEAYDSAARELHGDFARLNFPAPTHPKRVAMARLNDCEDVRHPSEPKRVVRLGPTGARYIELPKPPERS